MIPTTPISFVSQLKFFTPAGEYFLQKAMNGLSWYNQKILFKKGPFLVGLDAKKALLFINEPRTRFMSPSGNYIKSTGGTIEFRKEVLVHSNH